MRVVVYFLLVVEGSFSEKGSEVRVKKRMVALLELYTLLCIFSTNTKLLMKLK